MNPALRFVAGSCIAVGLLSVANAAQPSVPVQQDAARRAPAAQLVDPNSVGKWALQALALVDRGQLVQLWDGASPTMKQRVKREDFVAGVQASRRGLAAIEGREWLVISRQLGDGQSIPGGEYVTAEFLLRLRQGPPRTELVTFHRDEDRTWRFMGYSVR